MGFKNLDIIKKKITPFTSIVQDTSDLPPKIFYPTEVELKGEQADFYQRIKNEIFVTLQEAGTGFRLEDLETVLASEDFEEKIASLDSITVDFILTKRIRLREILGGFIKTDAGHYKKFKENAKLEFLFEDIEDIDEKIIIWATFTYEIELITKELLRKYSRTEVFSLYGKTRDYNATVESFKKKGKFLVANPAVGGTGFDIPQASINYYYSRDFNAQNFWQSQDRTHRIGQTKNVIYKIIVARNTVDVEIEKNLVGKYDTLKFFLEGDPHK